MSKIQATVVADSLSPQGKRLRSLLVTMPRFILAELNTHRMLSKNTSSSRAIPFKRMVEIIKNDPFIPIAWQKDHSGMQGMEYYESNSEIRQCIQYWENAKNSAVLQAELLNSQAGVTKQLCNRLLEPFMWATVLISGTEWENFFSLRCPQYQFKGSEYFKSKAECIAFYPETEHFSELQWLQLNKGQAEIHMMATAEVIYDAMNESTPKQLQAGEWHIPFANKINFSDNLFASVGTKEQVDNTLVKISTAMAARTSYTTVGNEKEIDYKKRLELHDRLITQDPLHASPLEHCAQVPTEEEYNKALKGEETGWFYNLQGFKSYRYILENSK